MRYREISAGAGKDRDSDCFPYRLQHQRTNHTRVRSRSTIVAGGKR
jgi:hypothetical protein